MSVETITIAVGVLSTITALVSIFFAWRAVKVAEKSNTIGLISEIQKQRWSETIFKSSTIVWKLYSTYREKISDEELISQEPITFEQAWKFVSEYQNKESSEEWKAVHELTGFWNYIALLVKRGFIDEKLVTYAVGSPKILGFLYPVEEAFIKYNNTKIRETNTLLKWYYELWRSKRE